MECDTVTGLAHWAPYLVNGDASGMEESDTALCDAWARSILPYRVVSTVDDTERFTWSAHLYGANCSGATVCDYVAHAETPGAITAYLHFGTGDQPRQTVSVDVKEPGVPPRYRAPVYAATRANSPSLYIGAPGAWLATVSIESVA